MSHIVTKQLLLSILARRAASSGAATAATSPTDLLLLACSSSSHHGLSTWAAAHQVASQIVQPTCWGTSPALRRHQSRSFSTSFAASTGLQPAATSAAAVSGVQVGDVLDATVTSVTETGLHVKVAPGGVAAYVPRRFISKVKIEGPLSALFKQDEAIKVLVTGKSYDGNLYVATRHFEPQPGDMTKDKQAVFGNAQAAAAAFKQDGHARKEARQRFMEGVRVGDGPFDARVTRVDRTKVVMAVQGHLFSSRVHPTRIPKGNAVLGHVFQVWCALKTDEGVPLFSAMPPGPGSEAGLGPQAGQQQQAPAAPAPSPPAPTPQEAQPATPATPPAL